jgi:hypothetical protein
MKRISKTATTVITLGVWIAAFAAAAGTVYGLNRPLPVVASPTPTPEASAEPTHVFLTELTPVRESPVIHLAPFTIYGDVAPHAKVEAKVRCAPWRTLEMGSGAVQVCD